MKRLKFYISYGERKVEEIMEYDDDISQEEIGEDFLMWLSAFGCGMEVINE